jgi:hypothetical protein
MASEWDVADVASMKVVFSENAHVVRRELLLMDGTHRYDWGVETDCGSEYMRAYSFQTDEAAQELYAIHIGHCKDCGGAKYDTTLDPISPDFDIRSWHWASGIG